MTDLVASKRQTQVIISGTAVGRLWWPIGHPFGRPLSHRVTLPNGIGRDPVTLREIVAEALDKDSGDSSSAQKLTADSVVEVWHTWHHQSRAGWTTEVRTRSRLYEATSLPSISDLVDPETYSGDFYGSEE